MTCVAGEDQNPPCHSCFHFVENTGRNVDNLEQGGKAQGIGFSYLVVFIQLINSKGL